ncbi:DUF2291 domain-containing protein [Arthrospiribacter ruber]|uniref:DUF2291 family protein n=1 Tax=Arthrospiribacter ruber TaxID=2487934 RepID=A0A951IWP0_9BACT|nr:DUF2291 domain-containing protein [Arthrospiribacter ruber]MBW3466998.1 DUF2291 family protein [Arthrospiribacter ruber]
MTEKLYKAAISVGVLVLLVYLSVEIHPLSEYKLAKAGRTFDAAAFSQEYWDEIVLPGLGQAVPLDSLIQWLETDKEKTFDQYGSALSIGNIRYFLVKGTGLVEELNQDYLKLKPDNRKLTIAFEFIYGNAARDAFDVIDLNDFDSTSELNSVSEHLNSIIKNNIISSFSKSVKLGDHVGYIGVIELNRQHLMLQDLEIIPLQLSLRPDFQQ